MSYVVQTGETIAAVSRKLNTSFQNLKSKNPNAFGQTKGGRWFLKAGYELETRNQARKTFVTEKASGIAPVKTSNAVSGGTYTVIKGETIKTVAEKSGYSFQELKAANPDAVGKMANGRHFFYAGATLKMPGGFQESLDAAQNQSGNQSVTTLKSTATGDVYGRSSDNPGSTSDPYRQYGTGTETGYPERNQSSTTRSYDTGYRNTDSTATDQSTGVPGYRSTGFVRSSNAGPIFQQNPIMGADFAAAGQQSLTKASYVLEKPLNQDLNLAFGFVSERHDTEDFSHSRTGIENKGVTMGLRFRF